MPNRDNFSKPTREALARKAGYCCSFKNCGRITAGPTMDLTGTVDNGWAAHITAAALGGPRYDDSLTEDERKSEANGIWMCPTHGQLVDRDTLHYSVELLSEWKILAETTAAHALHAGNVYPVPADISARIDWCSVVLAGLKEKREEGGNQWSITLNVWQLTIEELISTCCGENSREMKKYRASYEYRFTGVITFEEFESNAIKKREADAKWNQVSTTAEAILLYLPAKLAGQLPKLH